VPLRQDLAVTGSINQRGETQAVGGVHHKIEGFFRTCLATGLTGTQGVVVPAANERNLVLRQEVCEAVSQGQFHVYSVQSVNEAVELLTSGSAPTTLGAEISTRVDDLVIAQLEAFNEALKERSSLDRRPVDSD
jgi:predicted ATP-dependent protease